MSAVRYTVVVATREQRRAGVLAELIAELERSGELFPKESNDAFTALCAPATGCVFDEPRCQLVIGTLFDGDRQVSEKLPTSAAIWDADRLIAAFWGGYVAITTRPNGVEILRDPSGAVSCYHFGHAGAHIFTSDPSMALQAASIRPSIDWAIVSQALVYRDLRPTRTALTSVEELQPGMAICIDHDRTSLRCLWSPWAFTEPTAQLTSEAEAVRIVGDIVRRCVGAWADRFQPSLTEISGGLDSAIVAAIMSHREALPHALTFGPAAGDPDETPFARAIATTLNLPLTTLEMDVGQIDLRASLAADLPRPCARSFAQAIDVPRQAHARSLRARAIFSGGGGDNVFCNLQSALPVVDRLSANGPVPSVFSTVADVAAVTQTNIWQVLRHAARRALSPRPNEYWPVRSQYISREALAAIVPPSGHPWLVAPAHALPGKQAHVRSLISIQNHLEARAGIGEIPIVSPLISQPIMEACLRIPTWLWCVGGQNRAIARQAFHKGLPAAIIDRASKGAFDGFCAAIIDANRAVIREMLLGGSLAEQGLLDVGEIESELRRSSLDGESGARILGLIDVEAWVRVWA